MSKTNTSHSYRKTQILTASPSELLLLLYNAAICFCEQASGKMEAGLFEEAHRLLIRAENIVMELSAGLRRDAAPEVVANLSRLYEFIFYRLFEANVSHNPRCISEALGVLTSLRDTWLDAIAKLNAEACAGASPSDPGSVELSA